MTGFSKVIEDFLSEVAQEQAATYTLPSEVRAKVRVLLANFAVRGLRKAEMFEVACHEEDRDLPRLKKLKDAAAGKK